MVNKKNWLGILAIVLVFGMMVVGCDIPTDDDGGYTFEFKIENNLNSPITKIEFFNGNELYDPVLETQNVNILGGEISAIYKVSGFNKKAPDWYAGENRCYFGIKLAHTYNDSDTATNFGYYAGKNNQKFLVRYADYGNYLKFDEGKW
jgi:hypothetical protein